MKNNFFIYIYLDPLKPGRYCYSNICFLFEPFYIGKTSGRRYRDFLDHYNYFGNKVKSIIKSGKLPVVILPFVRNLSEQEAFDLEIKMIKEIGRFNLNLGPLTNLTDGGEGTTGHKMSDEGRKSLRNFNLGKILSENQKQKISEGVKGINHPGFGKHRSLEVIKKISSSLEGKVWATEDSKKRCQNLEGELKIISLENITHKKLKIKYLNQREAQFHGTKEKLTRKQESHK